MSAAVSTSFPTSIAVDPNAELRSSIHEVIAEFNGASVRPSMVSAAHKKPIAIKTNVQDAEADSLQALLAALSFTPRDSMINKDILVHVTSQNFSFASPLKTPTAATPTTPWEKRQQSTPPTAAPSIDEDDDHPTKQDEQTTVTSTSPVHSPVRNFSSNQSHAAASAYVLSLPVTTDDTASLSSPSSNTAKRCKKFPTVDTNIPGAVTLRSSMSYKKGPVKLPFVPIAAATALKKRQPDGPAQFFYQQIKGVWATGKGIPVITPLMNWTEGAISLTAGIATGNGTLEHVDHNVLEPLVHAVDQHVLNPAFHIVGGIFGWNHQHKKKKN